MFNCWWWWCYAVVLRVIVEDALVVELVPKPLIFINFDSLFVSFFLNREYFLEKLMTYRGKHFHAKIKADLDSINLTEEQREILNEN